MNVPVKLPITPIVIGNDRVVARPNDRDLESALSLSLTRLARNVSRDVLSVPIHVYGHTRGPVAFTTATGIWVRYDVIMADPEHLEVYLAHEIFHHVIDDSATRRFDHETANIATDYLINWHLKELFGYDIRTTKFKGIYDEKLAKMPLDKACRIVNQRRQNGDQTATCGKSIVTHPQIILAARSIRRKFAKVIKTPRPLFSRDLIDESLFCGALGHVPPVAMQVMPVNLESMLDGLWTHLYHKRPTASYRSAGRLTTEQALAYAFPATLFRDKTVHSADDAMIASAMFVRNINNDGFILEDKKKYAKHKVEMLKSHLKSRCRLLAKETNRRKIAGYRRTIKKLSAKLTTAQRQLDVLRKKRPIEWYMERMPVQSRGIISRVTSRPPSLSLTVAEAAEVLDVPALVTSDTTRAIASIARRSYRDFEKISNDLSLLQRMGFPVRSTDETDTEGEGTPGEGEGTTDSNEEGSEGDAKSNEEGDAGDSQLPGSHSNKSRKVDVMSLLWENSAKLDSVLTEMQQFDTMLRKSSSKKVSNTDSALSFKYSTGNDMQRVFASELAAMRMSKAGQLKFWADYAAYGLYQSSPIDRKRYPVCICLDASGSMQSSYSTAAGFALAMISKLHRDKRGAALVIFSEKVTRVVAAPAKDPINLMDMLEAVLTPSFGGTNFDAPLHRAFDLRDELGWRNVMIQMITDCACTVHDTESLLARKKPRDNISAIVIGNGGSNIDGMADQVMRCEKSQLGIKLVDVGRVYL